MAIWGVIGAGVLVLLAIAAYKHHTTVRPETFEELIQLLKNAKELNDLKVSPRMSTRSGEHSDAVGLIADFTYAVCIYGKVDGKKLDFCEIVGERKSGSTKGHADEEDREIYRIRNLLVALERSRQITAQTGRNAPVWTVHGPFTEIDEQTLRTDATKYGISI